MSLLLVVVLALVALIFAQDNSSTTTTSSSVVETSSTETTTTVGAGGDTLVPESAAGGGIRLVNIDPTPEGYASWIIIDIVVSTIILVVGCAAVLAVWIGKIRKQRRLIAAAAKK
jgi:hypothetical protein